jgi:hypothetical protein
VHRQEAARKRRDELKSSKHYEARITWSAKGTAAEPFNLSTTNRRPPAIEEMNTSAATTANISARLRSPPHPGLGALDKSTVEALHQDQQAQIERMEEHHNAAVQDLKERADGQIRLAMAEQESRLLRDFDEERSQWRTGVVVNVVTVVNVENVVNVVCVCRGSGAVRGVAEGGGDREVEEGWLTGGRRVAERCAMGWDGCRRTA